MKRPDVSVIITTYNRRDRLPKAIESCFDENQDISIEVIVVDDGSTDGTRAYLEAIDDNRVHPIFQENQGPSGARNTGQEAARGRAIKFLDDDDYLCSGALNRQYKHLREEDIGASYGDLFVIDGRGERGQFVRSFGPAKTLFGGLTSGRLARLQFTYLFRREIIENVQWNESSKYMEDFEFVHDVAKNDVRVGKVEGGPIVVHKAHDEWRVTDLRNEVGFEEKIEIKCKKVYRTCRHLVKKANSPDEEDLYRRQGARGIWKEIHKVAPTDFHVFKHWFNRVRELDPSFRPERSSSVLEWTDRWFSPSVTERVINPIRQARMSLSGAVRPNS